MHGDLSYVPEWKLLEAVLRAIPDVKETRRTPLLFASHNPSPRSVDEIKGLGKPECAENRDKARKIGEDSSKGPCVGH